jgi:hypothetical protein
VATSATQTGRNCKAMRVQISIQPRGSMGRLPYEIRMRGFSQT